MIESMSPEAIDDVLSRRHFGHMGCTGDSRPYVIPLAFAYHNNVLYGQMSDGKKIHHISEQPEVCFQVEEILDKGWKSVQCWGHVEILNPDDLTSPEGKEITKRLWQHLHGIQETVGIHLSSPIDGQHGSNYGKTAIVFRIAITEKVGRELLHA